MMKSVKPKFAELICVAFLSLINKNEFNGEKSSACSEISKGSNMDPRRERLITQTHDGLQ